MASASECASGTLSNALVRTPPYVAHALVREFFPQPFQVPFGVMHLPFPAPNPPATSMPGHVANTGALAVC
jgi:hypothetical protein